ncbi:MAG: hypothetical protein Q8P13_02495 [bacterium]|nr:hypothetical protein [bacterium]
MSAFAMELELPMTATDLGIQVGTLSAKDLLLSSEFHTHSLSHPWLIGSLAGSLL